MTNTVTAEEKSMLEFTCPYCKITGYLPDSIYVGPLACPNCGQNLELTKICYLNGATLVPQGMKVSKINS